MRLNFHLFLVLSLLLANILIFNKEVRAVTANPHPVQYTQRDGSVITIQLKGDEFIHWAETTDGFTIMPNKSGTYEYATIDKDSNLVFSGIQAHNPDTRNAEEKAFILKLKPGLFFSRNQTLEMRAQLFSRDHSNAKSSKIGGFPTTGTRKLIMILANFADTTTTYTQADFDNYMNQTNYNGIGSFKDYYLEVSYGQLTVNTTVTVWVTLPESHDYYGPKYRGGEFAYDAIVAANEDANVDFSEYDNDSDGYADGVAIIHQGQGEESSADPNDIWSFSWNLQSAGYTVEETTFDGVIVSEFTAQPEMLGAEISTIGVMCHEFGHNLGAPDFYDVDYNDNGYYMGTGHWDLMAAGNWNGDNGTIPCHHNPWTKALFGWTNPIELSNRQTVTLRNAYEYTDVVRYNTKTANEYFLCENRQQTGFDAAVPGHGLIIYHVDGNYIDQNLNSNLINYNAHQGMYIKAANSPNQSGISTYNLSTTDTDGCPWPGTANKTFFTDATTPNARSWAGDKTNLPLTNISENNVTKQISFDFMLSDIYVDKSALPDGDGTPEAPFQSVTEGLNNASDNTYIHIASNTYSEAPLSIAQKVRLKSTNGATRIK